MSSHEDYWASDVPVSMPLPPRAKPILAMEGFVVTDGGLAHNITETDYAEIATPTFMPERGLGEVVYEDEELDQPFTRVVTF